MTDLNKIMEKIDLLVLRYLELGGSASYASQQLQELSELIAALEKVDPNTLN